MDDNMPNGNDAQRNYISVTEAQLGERVTNLGRRQTDLENEMRTGFRTIEQSIASLTSTLSERAKPQWQALSVMLAFAAILGGLAYMPIREATTDLKASVSTLSAETRRSFEMVAERFVSRQEMDWRAERGQEDRVRTDAAIADLRSSTVARAEWSERNRARDTELADLSRRVDEIRADVGAVYGTRDVIQDMKTEIDRLRQRLNERPRSLE